MYVCRVEFFTCSKPIASGALLRHMMMLVDHHCGVGGFRLLRVVSIRLRVVNIHLRGVSIVSLALHQVRLETWGCGLNLGLTLDRHHYLPILVSILLWLGWWGKL